MINGVHTLNVLLEVAEERHAQDERWGQQDHPVHGEGYDMRSGRELLCRTYASLEARLKSKFTAGHRSGALILLEEVMEALSAETPRHQRTELVQVAAVAVMMAEALDRAEAERHGPGCELEPYHGGDCGPSAVHRALAERGQDRIPDTFKAGIPLADMVSKVAPDVELTEDQKRLLDSLPDATLEIDLTPIPFLKDDPVARRIDFSQPLKHSTDPYDAVGGDLEALERARRLLRRAPVCGREAATAAVCMEHAPEADREKVRRGLEQLTGAQVIMPHAYNGTDRLHGICRCGEGPDDPIHRPDPHPFMRTYGDVCHCFQARDAATHRCPVCEHPFHPADQPCTAVGVEGIGECDCGD